MNSTLRQFRSGWMLVPLALVFALASMPAVAASLPDFTGLVSQNANSVVHVEAKYDGKTARSSRTQSRGSSRGPSRGQSRGQGQMPPGMPEIFRHFFGGPQMMPRQDRAHTSLGSGFIISDDGYILTNNHVVEGADKVSVRLHDRRTFQAKVVGTDKIYDIALLKIDADDLTPVRVGDSKSLKPGQWVVAIGMPFNFDYTVTQGIVSAVGRNLGSRDQPYTAFIQTDVPINKGNSGGPLFNMDGQVVGINSQIYSSTGSYAGISFSIPIDLAMDAVQQIKTKGYVSRGHIGVAIAPIDAAKAKALGLGSASGALVAKVQPGSPAKKAGVHRSDVIVAFNGHEVHTASELPPMVASIKPGTKTTLKVMRNGKTQTLKIKIGEMERSDNALVASSGQVESGSSALGLSVEALTKDQRDAMDLNADEGVVIDDITGMQARRAGLSAGDVILMVGQKKVGSVDQYKAATKNVKPGDTVMLLVRNRRGNTGFVTITVPKDD